jgi:ankyrin repeat protein
VGQRVRILVTPLQLAALQLDVASTAALLAAGADPNTQARLWRGRGGAAGRGPRMGTALHFVASAAPEELGPGGPGRGAREGLPSDLVQWRAAAIVELLLRHGANPQSQTDKGIKPFKVASGEKAALPWGKRACPAAFPVLLAAANEGADAVRAIRLQTARRVLDQRA